MPRPLTYPDEFLDSFIGIAETLDSVADTGNWPDVLLHIIQELIDAHLVIDRMFEVPTGISHRSTEARADHDQPGRDRLRHPDACTGRKDGPKGSAHARTMVRGKHDDTLDNFSLLLRDQPLIPEQADKCGISYPLLMSSEAG